MKTNGRKLLAWMLSMSMLLGLTACGNIEVESKPDAPASSGKSSEAQTADTTVLKIGHTYALEDNFAKSIEMFANLVTERSEGRYRIDVYGAGQLGGTYESIEACASGNQQMCGDSISSFDNINPLGDIEAYPFLFDNAEQVKAFISDDLSKEYLEAVAGDDFHFLGLQFRGARFLQTTVPVRSIKDLKGLKLRTPPMKVTNRPWAILGCATVAVDMTEIYTALQQGAVEGQENPLFTSYSSGFFEIEKYLMNTRHVFGMQAFAFNKKLWESFSPEDQQMFEACAKEAADWRTSLEIEKETEYIQLAQDNGMEYIELEDLDAWKETIKEPMLKEYENVEGFNDWVAKIQAFAANVG
ncbi:MAG: TRAP transporter substrate-binding protein [Anaerotruncus sp.]|nr:TRAP transporter substrate-binding protein [Anaerotruncus sp.]